MYQGWFCWKNFKIFWVRYLELK